MIAKADAQSSLTRVWHPAGQRRQGRFLRQVLLGRLTVNRAFAAAGDPHRGPGPRWACATGRLAAIGLLLALAVVAWVVTDLRMAGMDAGPGTDPGALGFYVTTWVVMMAAMMFPSIAPMVLTYRNVQRRRRDQGRSVQAGATSLFVGGYLAVWAVSGLVGYAVLKGGRALDGGLFAWDRAGRWTAAAVILVAALYEFTPLKRACLRRCRGPLAFLLGSWRGRPGRRLPDGGRARRVVPGLLLGADGRAVRAGSDEPDLDAADRRVDRR